MTGILIYSLGKEEGFIEVMRYDIERIKRDAYCRIVAASIGMKVNGQFCECVSGIHSETQINHCSLTKEYYHCFSCGDAGDVVTMVRKYCISRLFIKSSRVIFDDPYLKADSI